MTGFLKYMLPVWATGVAMALVFAMNIGDAERSQDRADALSNVSKQAASVRLSLENLSEKSANELTRIIESEIVSQDVTSWLTNSAFESVALLGKDATGSWTVEWSRAARGGDPKAQFQKWLPNLPLERVQGDTLTWNRVDVPQQRPKLLLGVQLRVKSAGSDSLKVAVGTLPLDYLSALTEPLKGGDSEIFLVDSAGYSLTFPDARYLGSRVEVHPIVNQLLRVQKVSDFGDFRNLAGDSTVGGYERAKNSNVYVVVNQAVLSKTASFREVLVRSGLIGFGLLLLGSLLVAIIHWRDGSYRKQLEERVALAGPSAGGGVMAAAAATPTAGHSSHDGGAPAQDLLQKLGLTFFSHLRGPVYAALGQVHLLREKLSDKSALESVNVIEAEVRRTRDFIEGLNRTLRLESRPVENVDLNKQIEGAASKHRDAMARRSVEFEFSPHVNGQVKAGKDDLDFVIGAILDFAVKKLAQSKDKRKLIVKLEKVGGMSRVLFHLTGYHFSGEEAKTLFEFQKEDSTDLALARGFVLSWNGNLTADPSLVGGKIYLELPSVEAEPVAKAPEAPKVAEPAATRPVVIPTIPMAPSSAASAPAARAGTSASPSTPTADAAPVKTGLPPNILSVPNLNLQKTENGVDEDADLEISKTNVPVPEPLLRRRVTEELDRILPTTPTGPQASEVSVVNELTATSAAPEKVETPAVAESATEQKNEPAVQIRKPKVRYDI